MCKKVVMPPFNNDRYHPGLSVDCVIFGFHQNELKVLLLKFKNIEKYMLPGGFVEKEEDVNQAATHVLRERTGLENIFLTQFHLFGNHDRISADHAAQLVRDRIIDASLFEWFNQRFVSIGYYALVEYSKVAKPKPDFISDRCEWYSFKNLPELIIDHRKILMKAYETLKVHLRYQPIGLNLLPKRFTMPELQSLYETVLDKKLDRRNFQRKMLAYDILIRTPEVRSGGAPQATYLYEFDEKKYERALQDGLTPGW